MDKKHGIGTTKIAPKHSQPGTGLIAISGNGGMNKMDGMSNEEMTAVAAGQRMSPHGSSRNMMQQPNVAGQMNAVAANAMRHSGQHGQMNASRQQQQQQQQQVHSQHLHQQRQQQQLIPILSSVSREDESLSAVTASPSTGQHIPPGHPAYNSHPNMNNAYNKNKLNQGGGVIARASPSDNTTRSRGDKDGKNRGSGLVSASSSANNSSNGFKHLSKEEEELIRYHRSNMTGVGSKQASASGKKQRNGSGSGSSSVTNHHSNSYSKKRKSSDVGEGASPQQMSTPSSLANNEESNAQNNNAANQRNKRKRQWRLYTSSDDVLDGMLDLRQSCMEHGIECGVLEHLVPRQMLE